MSYFRIRACRRGHFEIDYKKVQPGNVCGECGEPVMDRCPSCGAFIREWYYYGSSMRGPKKSTVDLPAVCKKCGAPYPWADTGK